MQTLDSLLKYENPVQVGGVVTGSGGAGAKKDVNASAKQKTMKSAKYKAPTGTDAKQQAGATATQTEVILNSMLPPQYVPP